MTRVIIAVRLCVCVCVSEHVCVSVRRMRKRTGVGVTYLIEDQSVEAHEFEILTHGLHGFIVPSAIRIIDMGFVM